MKDILCWAKDIDVCFRTAEAKSKFDTWFSGQNFENSSPNEIADSVDKQLLSTGDIYDNLCFGIDEQFMQSIYRFRFGKNWLEEYSGRKN